MVIVGVVLFFGLAELAAHSSITLAPQDADQTVAYHSKPVFAESRPRAG